MRDRTNEEWLNDLRGPRRDEAVADLQAILMRGLRYALADRVRVSEADLEDFVQDATLRILDALDTFRGESRFTTWAHKIAIRVAFTELRRRRWQDVSLDKLIEQTEGDYFPSLLADDTLAPEQQTVQRMLWERIRRVIQEELTEKQRRALVAVKIHGMPLEEVARRMGTNRNALYKLLHDARKRLKQRLLEEGLSVEEIMGAFRETSG